MNLSSAFRTTKSIITANSPVLLVGTAIAGVVTTGVLAARGGYKARGIIDEATEEKGEELTNLEKLQLTWLCYAAPAVTGVTAVASVAGVHTIHTKRHAALAGLYAVTSTKMDDYREKAEEMLGQKKSQELNNAVEQKVIDRAEPPRDHEVIITSGGTELCHDDWSGRYFMGSVAEIEKAVAEINLLLVENGEASLNDFYDHLGLTPIQMGSHFGWSGKKKLTVGFGNVTTSDGRPAITVYFRNEPKENLGINR